MGKPMVRFNGLYQWDAKVSVIKPDKTRKKVNITVFCDTRFEAVEAACEEASKTVGDLGTIICTVDHITRIGPGPVGSVGSGS